MRPVANALEPPLKNVTHALREMSRCDGLGHKNFEFATSKSTRRDTNTERQRALFFQRSLKEWCAGLFSRTKSSARS